MVESNQLIEEIIRRIKSIHAQYGIYYKLASPEEFHYIISKALINYANDTVEFSKEEAAKSWVHGYTPFGVVHMLTEVWPLMHQLWVDNHPNV